VIVCCIALLGSLVSAEFSLAEVRMPYPRPHSAPSVTTLSAPPARPPSPPSDGAALGGYNVLIADRGNDRVLLVAPDKSILWEYDILGIPPRMGADDAFFANGGMSIIINLEHEHVIQIVDIKGKTVTWQYGELGKAGSHGGRLNYPDDAYQLSNGDVIVADIRNCRVIEIAPDKRIVHQAGKTGRCGARSPMLASPNGDTPLPNGHILVSTIRDHSITEFDEQWQPVFKMKLPLQYPSDPQMTKDGNFLVVDYVHTGKIIEISRDGRIVWKYTGRGEGGLNHPSLAIELPNGNILANDDLNHRVIVVDKMAKRVLWQYGVTGVPGAGPGYLSIPDGVDIIKAIQR
jgi:hypothetical protein